MSMLLLSTMTSAFVAGPSALRQRQAAAPISMAIERTYIMLKPDAVQRGLAPHIHADAQLARQAWRLRVGIALPSPCHRPAIALAITLREQGPAQCERKLRAAAAPEPQPRPRPRPTSYPLTEGRQ